MSHQKATATMTATVSATAPVIQPYQGFNIPARYVTAANLFKAKVIEELAKSGNLNDLKTLSLRLRELSEEARDQNIATV